MSEEVSEQQIVGLSPPLGTILSYELLQLLHGPRTR